MGAEFGLVPSAHYRLAPVAIPAHHDRVPFDFLNRIALHALDKPSQVLIRAACECIGSAGWTYDSLSQREETAIASVGAEDACGWIGTGSWLRRRLIALAKNGLGSKLRRFGVFNEPMCQAGCARGKVTTRTASTKNRRMAWKQ